MIWCRFEINQTASYGIVDGETVTKVDGSPFAQHTVTSTTFQLGQVKLLAPVRLMKTRLVASVVCSWMPATARFVVWLTWLKPLV